MKMLGGGGFSHVSRTNVMSPSLEADFKALFTDPGRGVPLKERNLPKSFWAEPEAPHTPKTQRYESPARRASSTLQPTDTTHFIAIKTPVKRDRRTPSPRSTGRVTPDTRISAHRKGHRKPKLKSGVPDFCGRASAPPFFNDDAVSGSRSRSLPDLEPHFAMTACAPLAALIPYTEGEATIAAAPAPMAADQAPQFGGLGDLVGREDLHDVMAMSHDDPAATFPFGADTGDGCRWMDGDGHDRLYVHTAKIANVNGLLLYETDVTAE